MAKLDQTSACRAVLIEVVNVLGAFRDEFVLIGGWVPEILYPGRKHIGSLDVDLAVSPNAVASNAYETIRKRLTDAGYSQQSDPTRFLRVVPGAQEPVKVDLISGKEAGQGANSILVNELRLSCLKGIDLAFAACEEVEIPGLMPDGAQNTVRVRVVRPEAFILIKAIALDERTKKKDAYDIAFVLRNYKPSLSDLANRLRVLLSTDLAREGYKILQAKFATINTVGPVWAAEVSRDDAGEDYEQARRAAFEDSQELFRLVAR